MNQVKALPVVIEQLIEAISELSKTSTVILVEQNFLVASKLAQYFVIIEEENLLITA